MRYLALFSFVIFCSLGCKSTEREKVASPYVLLSYDINEKGETTNIKIIKAEPKLIFNNLAIDSLSKWKYKPKLVDGKPVYQTGLMVQLDFDIEK